VAEQCYDPSFFFTDLNIRADMLTRRLFDAWRLPVPWVLSSAETASPGERVNPHSDADLIHQIATGNRTALAEIYDRYSGLIHALALRILRDGADAEEIVQDTFLQAWRQADRFDRGRGSASAWLVTIARSRALDRLRRRGPQSHSEVTESALVSEPVGDVVVGHAVRKVLDTLPVEQRRALELAYYEGLSQSEIAKRTGDPLGTVKTRIRLGLGHLRDVLKVESV
jgi:RNA polymerase sigma-70 factor (ECF subfamily)